MKEAPHPYQFSVTRTPEGNASIDLATFRRALLAGVMERNQRVQPPLPKPTKVRIFVDNELRREVPLSQDRVEIKVLPQEQYSFRLEAFGDKGQLIERTSQELLEKKVIRAVNPISYQGEPQFAAISPEDAPNNIDSELSSVVQKIGRSKVVFVWKNPEDPRVKSLKGEIDFRVQRDRQGRITGYTATDAARVTAGQPPIAFGKDDAYVKVDAAFNEHSFLWDDLFTCLHTITFDPGLCRNTLEFWLNVQKHHSQGLGDIPREVLKSNGTSFNLYELVHLGEVLPNGNYGNPNFMGDVTEQLIDQMGLGAENRRLAIDVLASMKAYAGWLDKHRVIRDHDGKFAGYWISDLGSGMDNIGRAPGNNFSSVGYLDELARRIEIEKSSARLEARLGNFPNFKKHVAKAQELEQVLNSRYWSPEKSFYYDLVPGKNGQLVRQEDMPTVAGFWALWSRSASPEQVKAMASNWYTDETFGGDFPVRSLPPIMQKLRPGSFYPMGGYWRGGNWPPTDVIKALGEERSGRPDLAARSIEKKIAADSYISRQAQKKLGRKTVYETIGTNSAGHPMPGVHIDEDGLVHETRKDFVGWGGPPHSFSKVRHVLGIRPVPGFGGGANGVDKWIQAVTENPVFRNTTYFGLAPWRQATEQRNLFAEGFLEINPPFTLGKKPIELQRYFYRGQLIDLKVESAPNREDGKKAMRVTISADGPLDLNLAFNKWQESEDNDPPKLVAMSRITKVQTREDGTKVIDLELEPVDGPGAGAGVAANNLPQSGA